MALNKIRVGKKSPPTKPQEPTEGVTILNGVTILGHKATIHVSADLKISQDYSSAGIQKGITFDTPVEDIEKAIQGMSTLLKESVTKEIKGIINTLGNLR